MLKGGKKRDRCKEKEVKTKGAGVHRETNTGRGRRAETRSAGRPAERSQRLNSVGGGAQRDENKEQREQKRPRAGHLPDARQRRGAREEEPCSKGPPAPHSSHVGTQVCSRST